MQEKRRLQLEISMKLQLSISQNVSVSSAHCFNASENWHMCYKRTEGMKKFDRIISLIKVDVFQEV